MSETLQIRLPAGLYEPLQRIAQATHKPLEEVVVAALKASLPPLDGLPEALVEELVKLEALDDAGLWTVMRETVDGAAQEELESLLASCSAGTLSDAERERLSALQSGADRVMLRKARAAVLLRFRGHRLPTLAEMRELDAAAE